MSELTKCPKCGNENPTSARFCTNCGNALEAKVRPPSNVPLQIPVYPGSFSARSVDHAIARMEPKKSSSLFRTKTGLGLILLGIILGPIPSFALYAGLFLIAGVVLVFFGRRAFGEKHQRYVSWSFILIIGGVVAESAGSFVIGVLLAQSLSRGVDLVSALASFFLALNLMLIVMDVILTLGLVFLTYDLQNSTGRTILWAAYSLGILMNAVLAIIILSQVQAVSSEVVSRAGTASDAIGLITYVFAPWRLLQLIPAIFYAIVYYKIWAGVERRVALEQGLHRIDNCLRPSSRPAVRSWPFNSSDQLNDSTYS